MDPVTHGLVGLMIGWAVAPTAPSQETAADPAGATSSQTAEAIPWAAVMAALVPDLDVFIRRIPGLEWVSHRGITHTFVAIPVIALLVALLLKLYHRRARLWALFLVAASAMLLAHLFADVITYRGIRPLLPWSNWRLNWPIVRFIDAAVSGPLLIAGGLGFLRPDWRRRAGQISLAWLAAYLGYRGWVYYS